MIIKKKPEGYVLFAYLTNLIIKFLNKLAPVYTGLVTFNVFVDQWLSNENKVMNLPPSYLIINFL